MKKRPGLTSNEWLMVACIVVIFCAILWPVLQSAREKAKTLMAPSVPTATAKP